MKRFLASLLAVLMLVSLLPLSAFAAETNTAAAAETQEPAQVVAQQLVLGDNLKMRFWVTANSENAAMNITVGSAEPQKIPFADVQQDTDGNYIFDVTLAAAQMTDTITLQAEAEDVVGAAKQYTVRQYADKIMAGSYAKPTTDLVQAMLNYGASAQVYFNHNNTPEQLANKGYESEATATLPEEQTIALDGASEGVRFYGASLSFRDRIALRYYFTGDISGMTVNAGDKPYTLGQKNGMSYVELADINPQDYSTVYTVSVGDGENPLSVSYSAAHYISRMVTRGSEDLVSLLKWLYTYHNAAIAYNEWLANCENLADYVIVYGDEATANEQTARDMIVEYIRKSTGVTLPIIPASEASYTADAKYLVIGNTGLGGFAPAADLGYRGYQIKSQDNSVFVCGGTDYGTICGAIGFLEKVVNLQAYGHKIVNVDKKSELMIEDFDLTVVPDIDMEQPPFSFVTADAKNMALWGIGQKMFGLIEGSVKHWHNSFDYLPPKDYALTHPEYYTWDGAKPVQLSYTANGNARAFDEMTTICADQIIAAANADPNLKALTLTQEDGARKWDDSAKAQELYNKYGTNTASLIIFMNAVADKVKAGLPEGRELDIYFFSYFLTYEPPVKLVDGKYVAIDSEVELRDNVGVMFAPIGDNFSTADFYSTDMYRQLCGWAALTDNLALWTYQTNFDDYFVFYNSFNAYSDIYKTAADLGVKYSYDQGQWNQATATGFSDLKAYIIGKLSWNVDADLDALYDAYFAARFGSANSEMRTLFNEMRAYFDELKVTYSIDGGLNESGQYLRADRFEKAVLERWLGYIEAALAKADNGAVRQHILLESLAVRYMWIELYGNTLTQGERVIAIYEFKKDCSALFVTMWSEGKPIEKLWERWENASMTVIDGYYYNFDLSENKTSYEIALPADAAGAVVGVYDANYQVLEGVTIGTNSITVSADAVSSMLGDRAYGDTYLHLTTSDTIYKIKVAMVTKIIGSYSDLYAIKAYQSGNVLDGYFALANDFDATGEDPICLIDFNDHINNAANSGVGFKGIFDGRGYTISNLTVKAGEYAKVGGLFGQILQGAVVRDVAFADMTTDGASAYTYLMTGESCRMMGNFQNVVISAKGDVKQAFGMVGCDVNNTAEPMRYIMKNVVISGVDYLAFTIKFPNVFENVILVSDEGVVQELSASIEDENATNSVIRYSTNDELFIALNEENIIAEWEDCDITYANTAINFNGKAIITELMNIVESEAVIGGSTNLTVQGNITIALKEAVSGVSLDGNTLTVASSVKEGTKVTVVATSAVSGVTKEFAIVLHRNYTDAVLGAMDVEIGAATGSMAVSGINGNAECLTYGATTVYEGYTFADGQLTISKELLDAMYLKLGLGEHTIYLGTDASYRYAITLIFATKIINTVEDLESISTTEATLDGYFVLNADLDFAGREPFALLAGAQNCYNVSGVGFKGTFDGRGHIISNLTTCNGGYRQLGGVFGQLCAGSVVKNVAFVNIKNNSKNASNIGFLLSGDASNLYGTVENVAVIGADGCDRVFSILRNAGGKLNNCLFLNVDMINSEGNACQISNVLSVTTTGEARNGGFAWSGNAVFNAQPNYATINDMFLGLVSSNIFENWTDTLFTYEEGQIFFNGKLLVQYENDLQGENVIYRGTSQSYISIDSYLDLKEEIEGVTVDWDYAEDGSEILIVTVDSSVPVGTEIVILAEAIDFPSVVKELVVTVQKIYTDVDLTGDGNMADIQVTDGATIVFNETVEAVAYGDSDMITEGISYADGKLSLTKEVIDAMVAELGLGEQTLKLYTTDDNCYAVTVTLVTKIINTVEDLESISTTEATLDGYYILNADLDCTGKTIALLTGKQSTFGSANIPDVGFKGTFDGRGHIISNLTTQYGGYRVLGGVFGQLCAGSVVKNVAFVNITSADANYLLAGDGAVLHGTMENVVVISSDNTKIALTSLTSSTGKLNNCFFGNLKQISVNGGAASVSNILSVTANAASNYGGFSWTGVANYNAQPNYATMDAAIDALAANNILANWENSLITYADGQIFFNGKIIAKASLSLSGAEVIVRGTTETYTSDGIISVKNAVNGVSITDGVLSVDTSVAENTVITLVATHSKYPSITVELDVQVIKVYEQIDWTDRGSIGDLETADSYSFIQLPEDMNGTVIGVSFGESAMNTGISVDNGELAIPKSFVTEIYSAYGYTEQSIMLYTSTDKCYTIKISIVTKAIANYAELQSIATTNATLDGYYVLTQDIGCGSEPVALLSGKQSTFGSANIPDVGFKGTFDGRGHIISNLTTQYGGYRILGGVFGQLCAGSVVKNVAFVNITSADANYLLAGDGAVLHGTMENVVVISSDNTKIALTSLTSSTGKLNNCFFGNLKQISVNGGAAKVSNILSVTTNAASNYGGFSWTGVANYNAQPNYATMDALYTALNTNNVLSSWQNALLTYENGKLLFNGTPLFFEDVVLSNPINLGDVSTVAKETTIDVPAEITGNIIGISTAGTGRMTDGITYENGKLTLTQKTVENLAAGGWGENSLKIYTDEGKVYSVSIVLVTKIITNQAELLALDTDKVLDGYYILANDIQCDGTTLINISYYTNTAAGGFIGTFDGRGHAIINANVGSLGLFHGIGAGTVKNLALVNVIGTDKALSHEIHGATIENVFISSDSCLRAFDWVGDSSFKNMIVVLPNGQDVIKTFGSASVNNTISNVYSVIANPATNSGWSGTKVVGFFYNYYKTNDPKALYNLQHFTTVEALLSAMDTGDMLSGWNYFSYADGKLSFGENVVAQ